MIKTRDKLSCSNNILNYHIANIMIFFLIDFFDDVPTFKRFLSRVHP